MKLFSPYLHGRQGVALVVVLAFVVLLTGLIVAFFSRAMSERGISNSSANQTKAELFAQGALDTIVGDLKQEIAAGSSATTIGTTTVYSPTASSTTMPNRVGTSTNLPTLVKRSASALPFFAGAAYDTGAHPASNRASTVPSTSASANGRVVTPARWNKPLLLPKKTPASDTDLSPLDSGPTPFVVPDWIYVSRDGSNPGSNGVPATFGSSGDTVNNPSASNSQFVIGRFAYTIYDEGALLDMNVAGYPVDSPPVAVPQVTTALQSGGKGVLAYADLTQLPGIATSAPPSGTAFSATRQSNIINAIVGWRNYASSSPSGTFPSYSWTPAQGTNYFNFLKANKSGFLKTANSAMVNGQTDKMFLSRQALMKLLLQGIATNSTERANLQAALQYMGTFSRAVTAPSWSPSANASALTNPAGNFYGTGSPSPTGNNGAGNIYAYKDKAETAGFANRNLANVRFPASGTLTRYNDDGTTVPPTTFQAGDPLIQRRFSLAKLAWLQHDGSALSSALREAVKDCFGLRWGTDAFGNPCWKYDVHGTPGPTSPQTLIMTLDQVAAQGREPDFFELLKAAILTGSLGRDPGKDTFNFSSRTQGSAGKDFDRIAVIPDAQIIQIGANIIDQYDEDSYPTAIFFQGKNADDLTVPANGPLNVFYGLENLPYLNRVYPVGWYTVTNGTGSFNGWMQPELWNPFQSPASTAPNTGRPTSFTLQAYGAIQMRLLSSSGLIIHPLLIPTWSFNPGGNGENEANIYFKDPFSSGVSSFANPKILTVADEDTSVATTPAINRAPDPNSAGSPNDPSYGGEAPIPAYNQFLAIHIGATPYVVWPAASPNPGSTYWNLNNPNDIVVWDKPGFIDSSYTPSPIISYCLKYYDGARFLPYTYMSRIMHTTYGGTWSINAASAGTIFDAVWGASQPRITPFMHTDPLTDRFSGSTIDGSHGGFTKTVNRAWQFSAVPGDAGQYDAPWPDSGGFFYDYPGMGGGPSNNGVPNFAAGNGWSIQLYYGSWAQNQPFTTGSGAYYADPDGIVRPGNDCLRLAAIDGVSQAKDGYSMTTGTNTGGATSNAARTMGRRPLILNRPFRSVAELGYAHRDLPFKSLDFFTSYSADSALLDVFSVKDEPPVVAGRVNPNNAPAPVLQAILAGAAKQEVDPTYVLGAEVSTAGTNIATAIAGCLATIDAGGNRAVVIGNRADLVNKLGVVFQAGAIVTSPTASVIRNGFSASKNPKGDQANKTYIEAPVRALADVTNTRTWNLMIDVVAQTGKIAATATNLDKGFIVEGERRYWLHVAIDRFTGKVIDQQLESVYE